MNNKKKIVISFVLVSFLSIVGQTLAQTKVAGVNEKDEFVYDYNILWNSTNPSATIPPSWIELNKTKSLRVVVENVSGQIISADFTFSYENGTTQSTVVSMDILKGEVNAPLFVQSNLAVNESFCTCWGQVRVNETATENYPWGSRETNHIKLCGNMTDYYCDCYCEDNYYDKNTGVLVSSNTQWSYLGHDQNGNLYNETILNSKKLVESSAWTIPKSPSFAVLAGFIIILGIAGALYYRKKLNKIQ